MAIDSSIPRTRRALLAGGIGGLTALVASALGRPLPAEAASGSFDSALADTPAVDAGNTAASGSPAQGVYGRSDSTRGMGVYGYASASTGFAQGVNGLTASTDGTGVYGYANAATGETRGVYGRAASTGGTGVYGYANAATGTTRGVFGYSLSSSGAGVVGYESAATGETKGVYGRVNSPFGTGVIGYSGTDVDPTPVARTGVYGCATQDTGSRGVHGRSTAGRGIFGQASSGQGVRGYATSGTAVYAASADPMAGYALRALGRVKLDQCAGTATIASGAKTKTVTPGIDLVSTSAIVATLMGDPGGTTTVQRVSVNTTANTFTIHLTANATADVKVAWHVFG
jgi:hypothetical protein